MTLSLFFGFSLALNFILIFVFILARKSKAQLTLKYQQIKQTCNDLQQKETEFNTHKEYLNSEITHLKETQQNLNQQYIDATKQHAVYESSHKVLQERLADIESHNLRLMNENSSIKELKIKFESELNATNDQLKNERQSLEKATLQLQDSFKSLAAQALEGNNKQFLDLAKSILEKESTQAQNELDNKHTSIINVINPIKESLDKYIVHINDIEKERQKSYSHVEAELKKIMHSHESLAHETSALKNALKKPHIRGRWGEVQLKNCIELAGMSEHSDVKFQDVNQTETGRLIPDLTVRMPGGRLVIVDAKTPIDAFLASLESTSESDRRAEMERHGRHVKSHIQGLAAKAYSDNIEDSADFIVMFLPNESFLYAALEVEPEIMEYALNKKILIATPPTFIGLLKVIRFGWNEEKLAENAKNISTVGQELHKRLCDFTEGFISIGKHIDKASEEYNKGFRRLESRVIVQAKRLEKLGAKSAKALPRDFKIDEQLITSP